MKTKDFNYFRTRELTKVIIATEVIQFVQKFLLLVIVKDGNAGVWEVSLHLQEAGYLVKKIT